MTSTPDPLLRVSDLSIRAGRDELVQGISFDIFRGERVGLIGESGSGKSLTCLSIIGLLDEGLHAEGSITFDDGAGPAGSITSDGDAARAGTGGDEGSGEIDLLAADEDALSRIRGDRLSMVFQEPMTALNPLMKVGDQLGEAISLHQPGTKDLKSRVIDLLDSVQLPAPARTATVYPHQLSGGQRQRVMLAMAMANGPDLLLADEPTTALDVTVQKRVLELMGAQVRRAGSSLLFITHDLGVVSEVCDRVLIMRQGRIVESGPIERVFTRPQHPYTRSLLAASALETDPDTGRLVTLNGTTGTGPVKPEPPRQRGDDQPPRAQAGGQALAHLTLPAEGPAPVYNAVQDPAIRVRDLSRTYGKPGLLGRGFVVPALQEVSFDVALGQRFGIVGESGSGKSTLLRLLTALDEPTSGTVDITGAPIAGRRERHLRWLRETVQIVFQDPMGSLDPRMRVLDIIAEPLRTTRGHERRRRVEELLDHVGLPLSAAEKYPHQFSGGQRQRIAIARALVTRPQILIADEAVSALDVSVRAQVLNLLDDLVDEYHLTLVFVSHDLNVVQHSCDVVAVMNAGRIVECGPADTVIEDPRHPYTAELVAALPRLRDTVS